VCIKVGFSPSSASSFDGRQLQPQVRNEIAVLQELSGIVGVPTALWSRDLKTSGAFNTVLVTREVGVVLPAASLAAHGLSLEQVFNKVYATLLAVHEKGFCHHDISPNNLIIVPGESASVVLIDWGLAQLVGKESTGFSGTPIFSSLRYHESPCGQYLASDDIESLIYTLCFVHYGSLPWSKAGLSNKERPAKKKKGTVSQICGVDFELNFLKDILRGVRNGTAHGEGGTLKGKGK
jgi:serine/threonine protein kinase